MLHIFLQKDNIIILGDVYEYTHKINEGDKVVETREQKAVLIEIIIVVNGKQKLFQTNYDLEACSYSRENGEAGCSGGLGLKDYHAWNDLKDFLIAIGYDLQGFNITNALESTKEY